MAYFGQFGRVIDSVVMRDRETRLSRRFGFVRFEHFHTVDAVMEKYGEHGIAEKWVDCRRSTRGTSYVPREGEGESGTAKDALSAWPKVGATEKKSTRAARA